MTAPPLTKADAARRLGISVRTLGRRLAHREIAALRPSPRRVVITEAAIAEYEERQTTRAITPADRRAR